MTSISMIQIDMERAMLGDERGKLDPEQKPRKETLAEGSVFLSSDLYKQVSLLGVVFGIILWPLLKISYFRAHNTIFYIHIQFFL